MKRTILLLVLALLAFAPMTWAQPDCSGGTCVVKEALCSGGVCTLQDPDTGKEDLAAVRKQLWELIRKQPLSAEDKQLMFELREKLVALKGGEPAQKAKPAIQTPVCPNPNCPCCKTGKPCRDPKACQAAGCKKCPNCRNLCRAMKDKCCPKADCKKSGTCTCPNCPCCKAGKPCCDKKACQNAACAKCPKAGTCQTMDCPKKCSDKCLNCPCCKEMKNKCCAKSDCKAKKAGCGKHHRHGRKACKAADCAQCPKNQADGSTCPTAMEQCPQVKDANQ